MVVKSINLTNFRNYRSDFVEFVPGINFICGKNGQGKTNLIESLYVITHLKSFRTSRLKDLCHDNENMSVVRSSVSKRDVRHDVNIQLLGSQKKVFLDGKNVKYTSDYIRNFFSILFSPDQLTFFKEYPLERRNFFDRVLTLYDQNYFQYVKDFNKIKNSKGVLLKQQKGREISIWNQLLAGLIPKITKSRNSIVDQLNLFLSDIYKKLTNRTEKLTLHYKNDFETKCNQDENSIYDFLQESVEMELSKGFLCYGPQKDKFWLSFDRENKKRFFSQGEYRISFLALQLSVNKLIVDTLEFYPTILLDDIFSELDQELLLNTIEYIYTQKNQVFITSTSIPKELEDKGQLYSVEQGKVA